MSVHNTLALDGQHRARQEFVTVARQHGASVLYTTTILAVNYEEMLTEVLKLEPQKRKNWKRCAGAHCWTERQSAIR